MQFEEFLRNRLASGGFTTEDTLASLLPLFRQAADAHERGQVAPLEELAALHVEGIQVGFPDSELRPPRQNRQRIEEVSQAGSVAFEIIGESRVVTDLDESDHRAEDLQLGQRDAKPTRPVYLPGYIAWEHLLDHHDPITDVFSLGMLLAGLACGLDLGEDEQLAAFVRDRRNLFALNTNLHPVLARAITRMTELDRHRRPQDLAALVRVLENYRDQPVDFDLDLARAHEFGTKSRAGKQQVILAKLQERLFEISRRNRLLHYRATLQTVNLTDASVPLSFDVRNIRPDQILTWPTQIGKDISGGKSVSLNRYLNFREAVYLPSTLDRIRLEAQRDQQEYGFAQLKLVACFLRWADLKAKPPELYESPLVLVPVALNKKKGIRDSFWVTPLDTVAEINPVVRHLFKQLYDIELPESLDLEKTTLDEFHQEFARRIESSEPAIILRKIDKPRIRLIHDKARRRLDQYRRRARLAGRGIRSFLEIDYSYDPANYHPLGLKLFNQLIRAPRTHLESIIETSPRVRHHAVPVEDEEPGPGLPDPAPPDGLVTDIEDPDVAEKEKQFAAFTNDQTSNPFEWEFDLCSLTLGNFNYRKMSLVRDYRGLLDQTPANAAFEATFSLAPRDVQADSEAVLPLAERFHVVPCDPTQTAAIAEARAGKSYIIQGPPGTGKSQTITNLIADYIARDKRVLFVCEKRAAIDVVHHRLQQKGLDPLCCLIHDSQADKKSFVMALKLTYENFLGRKTSGFARSKTERMTIINSVADALQPLEDIQAAMTSAIPSNGLPTHQLLRRLIELKAAIPEIDPSSASAIPDYAAWHAAPRHLERFEEILRSIQPDGIFAHHPLQPLNPSIKDQPRPGEFIANVLAETVPLAEALVAACAASGAPGELWADLNAARQFLEDAEAARFLAEQNQLALLDHKSAAAAAFREEVGSLKKYEKAVAKTERAASHWRTPLPPDETAAALAQSRFYERDPFRFLKPRWWRLRGILKRCYNFAAHQIEPTWTQALEWLDARHRAQADYENAQADVASRLGLTMTLPQFMGQFLGFEQTLDSRSEDERAALRTWLTGDTARDSVIALAQARPEYSKLREQLEPLLAEPDGLLTAGLPGMLKQIEAALGQLPDFLEALRELAELPPEIPRALRIFPWRLETLEAAAAARGFDDVLTAHRELARFDGQTWSRQAETLAESTASWQAANARYVVDRVRDRFLENVKISSLPAAQLTPEQKEFKKSYARGRRALEHEFGKSMRYKPIRELVSGESALVVRDLKPVWLMSPLSVSDTLALDAEHFDVVIFDEASQITLEEAIPSLFRATQAIVVGDEMQLPPTNFFASRSGEAEESLEFEDEGELVEYDLDGNSFLNHAARNLPSRMLGWHYRSRSESLISFSNWAFYHGRLLTVPDERRVATVLPELIANTAGDGATHVTELINRPVSFHFLKTGIYEKRRNRAEAEYIAELVRGLLALPQPPTIGIVAFSEAQQGMIESALDRLADDDRDFRARLDAELEREEDDQFAGLLVKNLENIQGDERDVILMSVCYGRPPEGRMRMNFGPINQTGGEKRLNVAFSRAKHNMALVSSIRSGEITNDHNDGANCLKNYLQYAEACSVGDEEAAQRILRSMSLERDSRQIAESTEDAVVRQLAAALRERGFEVTLSVGQSHFRCDLAVSRPGDEKYRLGILIDTARYYAQTDILERDLMKPKLLQAFGWETALVHAKDWWEQPERVLEQLLTRLG